MWSSIWVIGAVISRIAWTNSVTEPVGWVSAMPGIVEPTAVTEQDAIVTSLPINCDANARQRSAGRCCGRP